MNWQIPPRSLTLAPDEIHIWKACLIGPPSYLSFLSEDEQKRARRFILEKHRNRFITGRAILRILLGNYLHVEPQEVCFAYQANGKPEVKVSEKPSPFHFNLSHTGDLAVYAITLNHEVGIDVECVKPNPRTSQIAHRFFSPTERKWLMDQPSEHSYRDFSRLWTLKEAYLKVFGRGIGFPLDQFTILPGQVTIDDLTIFEFEPEQGYVAALIGFGSQKKIRSYDFSIASQPG